MTGGSGGTPPVNMGGYAWVAADPLPVLGRASAGVRPGVWTVARAEHKGNATLTIVPRPFLPVRVREPGRKGPCPRRGLGAAKPSKRFCRSALCDAILLNDVA